MKVKILKVPKNIKAYGGPTYRYSGNWTNNVVFINAGGLHSENPFEGVQLGVDNEGTPNMVEEGEIIYNNYVFSNRLKPTESMLEEVGLNKKYKDWTFAKIIEDLQLESSQNPTDWIVENTLEDNINRVMTLQERVRAKKNKTQNKNIFAGGGPAEMYPMYPETGTFEEWQMQNEIKRDVLSKYGSSEFNAANDLSLLGLSPYTKPVVPEQTVVSELMEPLTQPSKPIDTSITGSRVTETFVKPKTLDVIERAKTERTKKLTKSSNNSNFNWQSLGRLAPVLTNAGTLISNMRKPDYSQADRIEQAARNIPGGSFTPLGDFVNLESVDRNYLLNPMINTSRSTARDIQNQGLNAGQAMAGLLANNYNTQRNIGNALIQADQENMNRALQEAQFNRGTNQANAQMGLQALAMDQQRAQNILAATEAASRLRQTIDAQRNAAISSSLTGLSEDLSGLGQEATQKDWLKMLVDSGALQAPKTSAKNGGLLTKRKRRK